MSDTPTLRALIELVEDFNGWWHLNREGSVNAAYARIDAFTKAARSACEAASASALPAPLSAKEQMHDDVSTRTGELVAQPPPQHASPDVAELLEDIEDYIRSTEPQPSSCATCGIKVMLGNGFSPMPSGMPFRCPGCGGTTFNVSTYCPSADPRILLREAADLLATASSSDARPTDLEEGKAIGSATQSSSSVMALPAPEAPRDPWHPIATAPKDGTVILAWREGWVKPTLLLWLAHIDLEAPGWCPYERQPIRPRGSSPTHWMSLPDPPVSALPAGSIPATPDEQKE